MLPFICSPAHTQQNKTLGTVLCEDGNVYQIDNALVGRLELKAALPFTHPDAPSQPLHRIVLSGSGNELPPGCILASDGNVRI